MMITTTTMSVVVVVVQTVGLVSVLTLLVEVVVVVIMAGQPSPVATHMAQPATVRLSSLLVIRCALFVAFMY